MTELVRRERRDPLKVHEEASGGREAVAETLAYAPPTEGLAKVQMLLEDPAATNMSLKAILKSAGVSMSEYLEAMRKGAVARGHARASMVLAEKLPAVAADMAAQAVTRTEACDCTKTLGGAIAMPLASCEACGGRGVVTIRPEVERHQLMAEVAGLLKKGPQTVVQQNNTTPMAVMGAGFFDRLVKATDGMASPVVEATVVESKDTNE